MVSAKVKQEPQLLQNNTVYTQTHTLNLADQHINTASKKTTPLRLEKLVVPVLKKGN